MDKNELIYDWNRVSQQQAAARPLELNDESLRDGLQSPSVIDPPIEKKIEIIHLMDSLGIDSADIGLPGAGPDCRVPGLRGGDRVHQPPDRLERGRLCLRQW